MHELVTMDELYQYSGVEREIVEVLHKLYTRRNADGYKPRARLYYGDPITMEIGFHRPVVGHIDFYSNSCAEYEPEIKANCLSECGTPITLSKLLRIEETRKSNYPNVLLWEAEGAKFKPYELFGVNTEPDRWEIALADGQHPVAKGTKEQMVKNLDCYFGFRNNCPRY